MNDGNAKQQIVQKIKDSTNILVTVSRNPSVDELSAALGLTLLLNKMRKHATAVFSGEVPPAITFLDPQKTFENTVDSLRDFIIALDKEKADHLRYKVEGDVVKIFITPYRTTITSDDLDFSQGDYNVELVLGLAVKDRDDLDSALSAHGRILHDATVATVSAGEGKSSLGSIDWQEGRASSLSEMLVGLVDPLKSDKPLLDEQIATAFMTGIVAATDRFSNSLTSSKVMTVAAQLMTAGANQQLIASKLEEAHEINVGAEPDSGDTTREDDQNSDGTTDLTEGESTKVDKKPKAKQKAESEKKKGNDGELTISHEKQGDVDEVAAQTAAEAESDAAKVAEEKLQQRTEEVASTKEAEAAKAAEDTLAKQLAGVAPAAAAPSVTTGGGSTPSVADLRKDIAAASAEVDEAAEKAPSTTATAVAAPQNTQPPTMGGTLNATTEQAEEENRRAIEDDRNKTILSHGGSTYLSDDKNPAFQSPLNAASMSPEEPQAVDPFRDLAPPPSIPSTPAAAPPEPAPSLPPVSSLPPAPASAPEPTLAELDRANRATTPHEDDARAAVDAAFGAVPFSPAGNPAEGVGAQPLGEVPHIPAAEPQAPPAPPLPPLPDYSTLPPLPSEPIPTPEAAPLQAGTLPPEKLEDMFGPAPANTPQTPTQPPASNDPGQFKIPGQP